MDIRLPHIRTGFESPDVLNSFVDNDSYQPGFNDNRANPLLQGPQEKCAAAFLGYCDYSRLDSYLNDDRWGNAFES